jgi:tRNA threonylcarbamoyladenosine biosynthesis protein TsaB
MSLILDEKSIDQLFLSDHILFCGNANKKLRPFVSAKHASFSDSIVNATHLAQLSSGLFINSQFSNLAYCEPFYLKEFYSTAQKS